MSFEITFLGASGGPLEGNTCSLLLKSTDVTYSELLELETGAESEGGNSNSNSNSSSSSNSNSNTYKTNTEELLCIDAGSGMGKLTEIIYQESKYHQSACNLLNYYFDSEPIDYYYHQDVKRIEPFVNFNEYNTITYSKLLFNKLNNFLITHPHLDHVSSLVINSAGFTVNNPPKQVYGSKYTINSLQQHYFNGIVWPNMPSFDILELAPLEFDITHKIGNYDVQMFPVSHGELNMIESKKGGRHSSITTIPAGVNETHYTMASTHRKSSDPDVHHYQSTSFLISKNDAYLLVFGDFESDMVSKLQRNLKIWQSVAPLVLGHKLKGVVLECSNAKETDPNKLYGHLTPKHVIYELNQLNQECKKLGGSDVEVPLKGLNVIINHVKEPILSNIREITDPRKHILTDLNKYNQEQGLGCHISIALSGTTIVL
ncbi:PDE1 [Candida theae]|uniref:PDE1 n=1 Tax=Candida theae TaxID=1198502 RepID=A0AAD5BBH3_9ASCO|nr:PDE1 [Candida theae]KAI5950680.1 PDE1 [Candida theae]